MPFEKTKRRSRKEVTPPSSRNDSKPAPAVARAEAIVIAALLILAAVLRLWAPERMTVEHFDEGVYASNLWFEAEAGYQYPNRPLYAPPLLPFLIEWSVIALGPEGMAPMAPSLLAGWAAVALVWWTGRQWFGPVAGVASAALAATSEVHLLYSRAALTDVLLCFWWLASAFLSEQAIRSRRYDRAVLAGVAAGLAWWTKYNGWLTVGVAVGGATCWILATRQFRDAGSRTVLICVVIALTAFVVWSPVLAGLQSYPGGYGAVAANHAKYLVGLRGWFAAAATQWDTLRALAGPWTAAGAAIAALAAPFASPHSSLPRFALGLRLAIAASGFACILFIGAVPVLGVLTLAALIHHVRRARSPAPWLLLVWFLGLSFATPLYHPYPRLALPWLVATWLGAGLAMHEFAARTLAEQATGDLRNLASRLVVITSGAVIAVLLCVTAWRLSIIGPTSAWQSHTGLRQVAKTILEETRGARGTESNRGDNPSQRVLFVYAEPSLFYHLNACQSGAPDRAMVFPAGNLQFGELPPDAAVYLVAGLHARQTPEFAAELEEGGNRFEPWANYTYAASDLVLSDHFPPKDWGRQRVQSVMLYRVK